MLSSPDLRSAERRSPEGLRGLTAHRRQLTMTYASKGKNVLSLLCRSVLNDYYLQEGVQPVKNAQPSGTPAQPGHFLADASNVPAGASGSRHKLQIEIFAQYPFHGVCDLPVQPSLQPEESMGTGH